MELKRIISPLHDNLIPKETVTKPFFNLGNTTPLIGEPNCNACKLYKHIKHPRMNYTGKGHKKALVLGEAPGKKEDELGIQFIGESGQLFRKYLGFLGFDLDRDFWKINACNCRPINSEGENRTPTAKEISYCRPMWKAIIRDLKPQFIFLVGAKAIEAFYGDRKWKSFKPFSISKYYSLCIPDPDTNAWVIPLPHPSYFLRNSDAKDIFFNSLKWATGCFKFSPPIFENEEANIIVATNFEQATGILRSFSGISESKAIDYETNSLRPYWDPALLYSMSVSFDGETAYAFPYDYPGFWTEEQKEEIKQLWIDNVLLSRGKLIAHSIPMEESWNTAKFVETKDRWERDTLLRAHIMDTRDDYANLNFQVYINFGVYGYDSEVEPYKKSKSSPEGKTHFNTMHKLPYFKIGKYNGMDSKSTKKLFNKQRIRGKLIQGDALFKQGVINMTKLEKTGIRINVPYCQDQHQKLNKKLQNIKNEILSMEEAKIFRNKKNREFDIQAPEDIRYLLFNIMDMKHKSKPTAKQTTWAVDAEVLKKINISFTNNVLLYRRTKKIADYLGNFLFLVDKNGRIHPSFDLGTVKSLRSSSYNPNIQNIFKHDLEAKQIIRTGIIPSEKRQFLASDYGSMEVRIWCCYTKDPVLTEYLNTDHDMHGEWGEFFKVDRYDAKNTFVFPLIYGSYYKSIYKEFINRGYTHITEQKVKQGEDKFWSKYHYSKEWLEKIIHHYNKTGEVETMFGFTFRGLMTRNMIANYPIQSAAFHCLLWSLNNILEIQEKENWESMMCAQIHDEILQDAVPNEVPYISQVTDYIMTQKIREYHDWIHVPLLSEFSKSEIDGSWANMNKFELK